MNYYLLLKEDFLIEFGLGAINWTLYFIYLSYDYEDDLNGGNCCCLILDPGLALIGFQRTIGSSDLYHS